jgi:microsomal dipeptidase-like Zn-dependent dipeptidase
MRILGRAEPSNLAHHNQDVMGEDGVGLGSDFDGAKIPARIGNAARLQNLVQVMRAREYGEPLI